MTLIVTLDFSRHNHGSHGSLMGVDYILAEAKPVSPDLCPPFFPPTAPQGPRSDSRGGVLARPESALPKTCGLGRGGIGKTC